MGYPMHAYEGFTQGDIESVWDQARAELIAEDRVLIAQLGLPAMEDEDEEPGIRAIEARCVRILESTP